MQVNNKPINTIQIQSNLTANASFQRVQPKATNGLSSASQLLSTPTQAKQSGAKAFVTEAYQRAGSARQLATAHQAQGIGVMQGLKLLNSPQELQSYYQGLGQNVQNKIVSNKPGGEKPTIVDQLGSQARTQSLNTLRDSALGYLSDKLGIATSATNTTAAATGAASGAATGATAGTTATATTVEAGAAGAAGGAAGGAGAGIGAVAGKIVGAAGAAYSVYDIVKNFGQMDAKTGAMNGVSAGAYVGTAICPGIGTAIGAVVGGVAGACLSLFHKTGKSDEQLARDGVRGTLKDAGFLNEDCSITLPDGSSSYWGFDGRHELTNMDGTTRTAYGVDLSNPLTGEAIALAQPLAALMTGTTGKLREDFTGYLVNTLLEKPTDVEGMKSTMAFFYSKLGITAENGADALTVCNELLTANQMSEEEKAIYLTKMGEALTAGYPMAVAPEQIVQEATPAAPTEAPSASAPLDSPVVGQLPEAAYA